MCLWGSFGTFLGTVQAFGFPTGATHGCLDSKPRPHTGVWIPNWGYTRVFGVPTGATLGCFGDRRSCKLPSQSQPTVTDALIMNKFRFTSDCSQEQCLVTSLFEQCRHCCYGEIAFSSSQKASDTRDQNSNKTIQYHRDNSGARLQKANSVGSYIVRMLAELNKDK